MRAALIALPVLLACSAAMAGETPVPLKEGAGDDLTSAFCSACHTSDYIVMNSTFLTPDAWKAEVTKMRAAFGAPIDEPTAAAISAYLAQNYAVAPKP
jgi:hypothetical protein